MSQCSPSSTRRERKLGLLRRQSSRLWVVFNPEYCQGFPPLHLDPSRPEKLLGFLLEGKMVPPSRISIAREASMQNILRVHPAAYIESLQDNAVVSRIVGCVLSERESEEFVAVQRLMSGGTIQATRLALMHGEAAVNLGGGFHHASPESGSALCIFNDVAIAVRRLRSKGWRGRVLVVDLDLHDGNGTREAFKDDATVYTYSIHNAHWGPTEVEASLSIELGTGVCDERYLGTVVKTLTVVFDEFRPELVIYLAGADPAADDRLGDWNISREAMLARDRFVASLCQQRKVPMVVLLAGGYGPDAWRYPARFLSWLATGSVVEPPESAELALRRYRAMKAAIAERGGDKKEPAFSWSFTEEDLCEILPGAAASSRFLGSFSRHGVELLLEKTGILAEIRRKGFRNPRVETGLSSQGDLLRIWGDQEKNELLVELTVRRSRSAIPGCEVLMIDWLLMQNPRMPFTRRLRRLPGQEHPGLGMLSSFLGWLVLVTDMLGLEAICYTPSHLHVAIQSRKLARFLEPSKEARFRALAKTVERLPLAEASYAMERGCIIDAETGSPVKWEPGLMVLPTTEKVGALFGSQYQKEVERLLPSFSFLLLDPLHCIGRSRDGAAMS